MEKTNNINVLLACEESQAVCVEFRKRGFNAFSCDILSCSGPNPEWHIQQDVLIVMKGGYFVTQAGNTVYIKKWDAVISFPPCTHLAVSGAAWFFKKRESGDQRQAIEFFMNFINLDCEFVSVENPVGIISGNYIKKHFPDLCEKYNLPIKQSQIIEPYYFGDPANKKTCLWLKGFPLLQHDPKNYSEGSKYITSESGKRYPEWCWSTGGGRGINAQKCFQE